MSTFKGKLLEIPEISIDRFDGTNLSSEAFFLSHCHTDHMVGLENPEFHKILMDNNRFLYLSHVSAAIIKQEFPAISTNLVELDPYSPTTVTLGSKKYISVLPIPAGHCPGSVMFLFEGGKTVLYTGDYRINTEDIPKFKAFYDSMNTKKAIDSVYLDTTFFLKAYAKFPPRAESVEEICTIIKDWINRSEKHIIQLHTSAKYGYEYLFMEIFKEIKMPVHVNYEIYNFYSRVPDLDQAITRCHENTKIHSACGSTYKVICRNTIVFKIKSIQISAFRWKSEDLQKGISNCQYNNHYVCYSTHASYEEGAALLKFLQPKRVEANVLHKDPKNNLEIFKNIDELVEGGPVVKKMKMFRVEDQEKKSEEIEHCDNQCNILDSP